MLVWSNGKFVEESKVSTLNWSLHYGCSAWEGIRSYKIAINKTVQPFQLTAHINRLFDSAKFLRLEVPYTRDAIRAACRQLQYKAPNKELYFRPIIYKMKDAESSRDSKEKIGVDIHALPLRNRFNKNGIKVATSIGLRAYPEFGMQCKSSNNYGSLESMRLQAAEQGVDEVFVRDGNGYYTEASTANLFVVRDNVVMTPPNDGSILPGITRGLVMEWSKAIEKRITQYDLVTADEVFITGTYAEIIPVIEIDRYKIGTGEAGITTLKVRSKYFDVVRNPLSCLGTIGR